MAEADVEGVLREIRERVMQRQSSAAASSVSHLAASANGDNSPRAPVLHPEKLALIESYLATTARAWDRLPPLVSNRTGFMARLELWLKRHLKRATRWYAWEQVNFNAAVHHALRDMLQILEGYQQELRKLQMEAKANEARRIESEAKANEARRTESERMQTELASLRAETINQRLEIETQRRLFESKLSELLNELRERDGHLRDEQRVALKQLSLETTEAAVLEDRARRKTEALLEELARRVEHLEK
jgi:hypothetical protein